jgi:hypothetical protein
VAGEPVDSHDEGSPSTPVASVARQVRKGGKSMFMSFAARDTPYSAEGFLGRIAHLR